MSETSDTDLLASWSKFRSEAGFRALVDRYAGLVYMAAKRTCGDEPMAKEASQLTFLTLAQKSASLTSRDSLGSWLHVTAIMQAKNLLKLQKREILKRERLGTLLETMTPDQPSTLWQDLQPVLDEALACLSERDREAIFLRHYRSLSVREVAVSFNISVEAAQKRLDRALERLRRHLDRRGYATGGSLGSALLTGLASDAQAGALLASSFASIALNAPPLSGLSALTINLLSLITKKSTIAAALILALGAFSLGQAHRDLPAKAAAASVAVPVLLPAGLSSVSRIPAATAATDENRRLVALYGTGRTELSRALINRAVEVSTNVQSLLDRLLPVMEGNGSMPETTNLDPSLNLTETQRRKVATLSIDLMKRKIVLKKQALERISRNPFPVMEMLLIGDAFTRGEVALEEYLKQRSSIGPDLAALENPVGVAPIALQFGDELPFDDPIFMNGLRESMDLAQIELFVRSVTDVISRQNKASDMQRKYVRFTTLPPMELSVLDKQIGGSLNVLQALNESYQRMLEAKLAK